MRKNVRGCFTFFGLILIHAQRQSHIQETFMHLSINFCDGTDIIIRKNTFACFIAKNINEEDRVRSLLRINSCAAVSFELPHLPSSGGVINSRNLTQASPDGSRR
jgi:hypothetical protein